MDAGSFMGLAFRFSFHRLASSTLLQKLANNLAATQYFLAFETHIVRKQTYSV
jgi:hypothetical protein